MTSDLPIDGARQTPGTARGSGRLLSRVAGAAAGLGWLAALAFGTRGGSWSEDVRTVAGLTMIAGCASAIGGVVGFLFGIPRTLSFPGDTQAGADLAAGTAEDERATEFVRYRVNTNLEQISDWLTKILVGVGLAELHRLPSALRSASDYFASALGAEAPAGVAGFILLLLVYFTIYGFMAGYLGTRVLLAPLLKLADQRSKNRVAATATAEPR